MNGEDIIIAKSNIPVVKIIPIKGSKPKRKLGTAKGTIKLSDDFDAPIDDFKDYV